MSPKAKTINVNTASEQDLTQIEGLGRERAQALARYRNEHGAFRNWEDLYDVPGFSKRVVENMKSHGASLT